MMQIRDRIKELRRVRAGDLRPNPRNWRTHPQAQQDALRGILAEVGYADALLARELPDGALEIVDGHLRAEITPDQLVPVLLLDVTEAEAALILASLDPLAAMAEADTDALGKLLEDVDSESDALRAMLDGLAVDAKLGGLPAGGGEDAPEAQVDRAGELQKQWKTAAGQLWVIPGKAGEHRLLCGDSTKREDVERLMGGERAQLLVASLMKYLAEQGKGILDPFLGSGTTMVAAEELGRVCVGIEIEPKYVAVCLQRMADMGLEPKLTKKPGKRKKTARKGAEAQRKGAKKK